MGRWVLRFTLTLTLATAGCALLGRPAEPPLLLQPAPNVPCRRLPTGDPCSAWSFGAHQCRCVVEI